MRILIGLILLYFASYGYAQVNYFQDAENSPIQKSSFLDQIEFQFNFGLSFAGQLENFHNGTVADEMLQLEWEGLGAEFYSVNAIFYKNIGLSLFAQTTIIAPVYEYEAIFESKIRKRFEEDYYVNFNSTADCNCGEDRFTSTSFFVGLTYRIKKEKFEFYPGFAVGSKSFIVNSFQSRFKKRNSNDILQYSLLANSYETAPNERRIATVYSPSVKVAYRVHPALLFFIKPEYFYLTSDVSFVEKLTDVYTGEESQRIINYNNRFQYYNITIGVTFELSKIE